MTRIFVVLAALFMVAVPMVSVSVVAPSSLAAQTRAEIEAQPVVKLKPGATPVPGQCLTQQEFDLNNALNALRRPTVGVEADGDDQTVFDPHYFVGTWRFEGVLPESPLGESGEFLGTETIRHVDGCTYESTVEATLADEEITIRSRMIYDRGAQYLIVIEDDSRGFQLVKGGLLRGDPGGFFSHYWEAPAITHEGSRVRLKGRTLIASPDAYRLRMQMSVGDEPFSNFGTLWWERVLDL
jgi:hypothetical protein